MADQTGTKKEAAARTEFATTLLEIDKGRVHDDGTARLAELVDAVCRTAAKGTVTLKVHVEPLDAETFDDTGLLVVTGEVSVSIPRPKRSPSLFYATGVDGQITRTDPARTDPRD